MEEQAKAGKKSIPNKGKLKKAWKDMTREEKIENCVNCFTCEQGVDKNQTIEDRKQPQTRPFCWYLFPTNACNIACTYCYANNKPGKMTKDTMHKTLTWLFEKQPHKNITCHFFGGEPTVMWDMLVDMVSIGNTMAKNNGYNVTWSMTTNGTLLDSGKLDWIEKHFRPNNPFLLSIDGRPKTHDLHRITKQGEGTHHLIPVDEILKRFPTIECRPTIKPVTTKDWFEDFKWLRNKGFKAIAIEPDYEDDWTDYWGDYEVLMYQLAEYFVYAHMAGQPIPMKFINNVQRCLKAATVPGGKVCGVGFNSGGIDYRGKLYACQRYASYNDPATYALGDIENGWDEFRLFQTQHLERCHVQGDISQGFNCATCEVKQFCNKGCNAANIKVMGRRDVAMPNYCRITKIETKAALWALMSLGQIGTPPKQQQGQSCSCR